MIQPALQSEPTVLSKRSSTRQLSSASQATETRRRVNRQWTGSNGSARASLGQYAQGSGTDGGVARAEAPMPAETSTTVRRRM